MTLTPAYTPDPADAGNTVTLTLTVTSDNVCGTAAATAYYTINVNPLPTIDAGGDQTVCQGSPATVVTLNGSSSGAASASWTGGAGTFNPNRNTPDATYTPTAAEVNAGSVVLTLTANDPLCGSVSETVTITINKAVVITTQPVNTGVCESEPADLNVEAVGTGLTYQWYKGVAPGGTPVSNSANISGADTPNLHFNLAGLADEGSYYVVVSGACGTKTSNTVTLNVDAAITIITLEPKAEELCEGDEVNFYVVADANGAPLDYQWWKDGEEIDGATSSYYTITNITTTNEGDYFVVVSGQAGFACSSVTSETAALVVNTDATLDGPVDYEETVCVDNPISDITYTIGGSADGIDFSGSLPGGVSGILTGNVYTISGTPTESGIFNYIVTTTGSLCENPSLSGTITVNDGGTISLAGGNDSQEICINNPLSTITYSIGGDATGASITWDDTEPVGISGTYNSSNGLFTINGMPSTSGIYPFTVTTTGSPCENPSLSGEITVNEDATITLTSGDANQSICLNNPIIDITYTMGGSATNIVLTGNLPAGVTGTFSGNEYTISGTPAASGTFNYTLTTAGSCLNNSAAGVIQVDDLSDGGFISPAISTACTADNSGTLTLESYDGNVIQWEMSLDGGATWTVISNTTDSYTYNDIPNTALFIALVGNDKLYSCLFGFCTGTSNT